MAHVQLYRSWFKGQAPIRVYLDKSKPGDGFGDIVRPAQRLPLAEWEAIDDNAYIPLLALPFGVGGGNTWQSMNSRKSEVRAVVVHPTK